MAATNKKPTRKDDINLLTLGYPVGLTQGTINLNEIKLQDPSTAPLLTLCTLHHAFAYTFIKPPAKWSAKTINELIVAGSQLLQAAQKCAQQLRVPLTEANMLRRLQIGGHSVELSAPTEPELIGNLYLPQRPKVHTLLAGLQQFFRQRHSRRGCLFRCESVQLLIWRHERIFYVFDARGRNEKCAVDTVNGFAALICLESLRNVTCLIVRLSELRPDEFFVLAAVRVVKLVKLGTAQQQAAATAATAAAAAGQCSQVGREQPGQYVVRDELSAILHGTITVSNECFTTTRNCQVLTACCVAYFYSLVRPPNAWTSRSVDKCLLFGNQLYAECVAHDLPEEFTIRNIPPIITLGVWRAAVRVIPFQHGGRLHNALQPRNSELMLALQQFFAEHRCALLQVDQLTLAIWRRDNVYYLFDAYGRNANGEVGAVGAANEPKAACVQMHSTLESLCTVLYGNLMRLAEKELFYVHGLWARVLDAKAAGDADAAAATAAELAALAEDEETGGDAVSMNESVDSVFVPRLQCKGLRIDGGAQRSGIAQTKGDCNLDSPSVSATQFIRPWHMIKEEMLRSEDKTESDSDMSPFEGDDLTESDFEEEEEGPNNELGLSDDDYDQLQAAGFSDAEIGDLLKLGLSPHDMMAWHREGLSPSEVMRLHAIGITDLDEFRQFRKWGLTVEDLEQALALEIAPKMYAKMKKQGIEPDRMQEYLASKENAHKFRESNLNRCQIDKLTAAGVSADDFAQATQDGLTYEEVLHAVKHEIPSQEFAKMKDMGMSSVDIVRSKSLDIDPEEYIELKELGLSEGEMQKMKDLGLTAEELVALRKLGYTADENLQEYSGMKKSDATMTPDKYHAFKTGAPVTDDAQNKEKQAVEEKEEDTTEKKTEEISKEEEAKPTKPDDPARPGEEVKPVEAAKPGEDAKPGEPAKPVAETKPVEAAKDGKEGKLGQTAKPDAEINPGQSAKPGNEAKPAEATKPGDTPKTAEEIKPDEVTKTEEYSKPVETPTTSEEPKRGASEGPAKPGDLAQTAQLGEMGALYEQQTDAPPSSSVLPNITDITSTGEKQSEQIASPTSKEDAREYPTDQIPSVYVPDSSVAQAPIAGPKQNMVVIKSAACTPISFHKLLTASFKIADRVLIMNAHNEPNCVAFRNNRGPPPPDRQYFLYEGCACNMEQIRRLVIVNSGRYLTPCPSLDAMIARIIQRLTPPVQLGTVDREKRLAPTQQQAVKFARELLDEKLEMINEKFDDLMKHFATIQRDNQN